MIVKNNKGFNLIEVIIASTLLITVMFTMFTILQWCIANYEMAGRTTQLVSVAKGVMEETLAQDYLLTSKGVLTNDSLPLINYNVDVRNFNQNSRLKEIRVEVFWQVQPDEKVILTTLKVDRNEDF